MPHTAALEGSMSRKALIAFIVFGFILAIVQLIRITFSDTLDNGVLTISSLVSGIVLAYLLGYLQNQPNYPINAIFSITVAVICIATVNHKFAKGIEYSETFTVASVGSKTVRYNEFPYIRLTNQRSSTDYSFSEDSGVRYKVGDTVNVNMKDGYWGYPIILSIGEEASNKAIQH